VDHLGHVSPKIAYSLQKQQQESLKSWVKRQKTDFLWLTVKCTGIEQSCAGGGLIFPSLVSAKPLYYVSKFGLGSEALLKSHCNNKYCAWMVPFNVLKLSPGHYHGSARYSEHWYTETNDEVIDSLVILCNADFLPLAKTKLMAALLWAKTTTKFR